MSEQRLSLTEEPLFDCARHTSN